MYLILDLAPHCLHCVHMNTISKRFINLIKTNIFINSFKHGVSSEERNYYLHRVAQANIQNSNPYNYEYRIVLT